MPGSINGDFRGDIRDSSAVGMTAPPNGVSLSKTENPRIGRKRRTAMDEKGNDRAQFHAMTEGTLEDWRLIGGEMARFAERLPDRLIAHLSLLRGDHGGFPVDRLEHCLQTATRAHHAGRDEEYVVCALLHDIGDTLGTYNHADIAGSIVKPFVSEENHWMVEHHAIFQGYYFFHFLGLDRDMREKFRGHPHFERTEEFCRLFDQVAFDPNFKSMPLEAFEPMIHRAFSRPRQTIYLAEAAE
jgi:predicted HD phosphohydrolase